MKREGRAALSADVEIMGSTIKASVETKACAAKAGVMKYRGRGQ